jgi:dTDP-4-dehydrorhamnose 3,5-epimerase-like enzyme
MSTQDMTSRGNVFEPLRLPDDRYRATTAIDGLGFVSNYLLEHASPEIHSESKIISNPGSIVGHFVTHGTGFKYSTFGIHVGQMDRLTFYSNTPRRITGYFVDCRRHSPSRRRRVMIDFLTSAWRKLVIPCGVAHTFHNLEGVVTRNDLALFADADNSAWNLLNDDLVFPWSEHGIDSAPEVDVNSQEIPLRAMTLFYRLQRQLLKGGQKQLSSEMHLMIVGEKARLIASSTRDRSAVARVPLLDEPLAGCEFAHNSFNSVADASWAVIPTTASCVADWVVVDLDRGDLVWFSYHTRQTVLHTFLDGEGASLLVELFDLRAGSPSFRRKSACRFACDPRFHLRIPAGVAYRYTGVGRFAVRVEYEMFVDENEPRADLPAIGADRVNLPAEALGGIVGLRLPSLPLPTSVQQMLARREYETIEQGWEERLRAERSRLWRASLR